MEKELDRGMNKMIEEEMFYTNWKMLKYWYITKKIRGSKEVYSTRMDVAGGYKAK